MAEKAARSDSGRSIMYAPRWISVLLVTLTAQSAQSPAQTATLTGATIPGDPVRHLAPETTPPPQVPSQARLQERQNGPAFVGWGFINGACELIVFGPSFTCIYLSRRGTTDRAPLPFSPRDAAIVLARIVVHDRGQLCVLRSQPVLRVLYDVRGRDRLRSSDGCGLVRPPADLGTTYGCADRDQT